MEVRRVDSQHFTIGMTVKDVESLEHYAGVAGVGTPKFIATAILMHLVTYRLCPGYEPLTFTMGETDD